MELVFRGMIQTAVLPVPDEESDPAADHDYIQREAQRKNSFDAGPSPRARTSPQKPNLVYERSERYREK
jgi:hypothetical protein